MKFNKQQQQRPMSPSGKQIEEWEDEWMRVQDALDKMYHVGVFIVEHLKDLGGMTQANAEQVYFQLQALEANYKKRVEEAWEKSTRP